MKYDCDWQKEKEEEDFKLDAITFSDGYYSTNKNRKAYCYEGKIYEIVATKYQEKPIAFIII